MVSVSSLVLRGIKLVPTTCFSPQSRRGGSFDLVLAKRILRAEDKSDRVYSSCGRKMKTLPQLYSFVSSAMFSSENVKSESEERFKRPATYLKGDQRQFSPNNIIYEENLIKDQSIFPSVIILLTLTTFSLDYVWILLGEN